MNLWHLTPDTPRAARGREAESALALRPRPAPSRAAPCAILAAEGSDWFW